MWFFWALLGAFFSSISVTFNKRVLNKEVSPTVVSFFLFAITTLFSLPLYLAHSEAIVNINFWAAAAISALLFSIAKTIQLSVFQKNNLSDIYPLNALQPVTIYILSVLFLSEVIKMTAVGGIILMAVGIYILNYNYHDRNPLHPFIVFAKHKASQYYLLCIILANLSTISEKIALSNTFPSSIYPLGFWENLMLTVFTGLYVLKTNKKWAQEIKANLLPFLIAGVIYAILYFTVMSGIKSGPIALVSAVKKLEVLLVIIWSILFFKERPTKKVYIATAIMLAAVFLIKL